MTSMQQLFMAAFVVLASIASAAAFGPSAALPTATTFVPASSPLAGGAARSTSSRLSKALSMVYIPDGLSPEQWKAIQAKEKAAAKNLGKVGTTKFKSRSMQAFQEALERGEDGHLFPVDPLKVKRGEIPLSKVPYMQRGGSWDDTDLLKKEKGIQAKKWTKTDKEYARGGEAANQSVNIFGRGSNLPWQGKSYDAKGLRKTDPIEEQKKWARATSPLPPNKKALERVEKERAKLQAEKAKKDAQLSKELQPVKRFFLF